MLPPGGLSEAPQRGNFLAPDELSPVFNYPEDLTPDEVPTDWELAGVGLNDSTEGVQYQDWTFYMDGPDIMVTAPNTPPTVVHSPGLGVLELSGSFDSNMQPVVVWTGADLVTWLRWWNPVTVSFALSTLPALRSPRLTLDDKRASQVVNRDVLLFYIRNEQVCYRQQRDRYQVEYQLYPMPNGYERIGRVGMTNQLRIQIELTLACPAFGLPGIPVDATGCDNKDWCTAPPPDAPDAPPVVVTPPWSLPPPCIPIEWALLPPFENTMPCEHSPVTIFPNAFTYIAINGEQVMTLGAVSLVAHTSGVLPIDRGGTNATTPEQARTNLGLGSAATSDASAFATVAQGALADSAVQPGDDAADLGSGAAIPAGHALLADGTGAAGWGAVSGSEFSSFLLIGA